MESGSIRLVARIGAPVLVATLSIVAFYALGAQFFWGYRLDLGGHTLPQPIETYFWLVVGTFGLVAGVSVAVALMRAAEHSPRLRALLELFPSTEDRSWIAFASLAAFIIPVAIRALALRDAPIADDESCYRFGGELIARGKLSVESHPLKLFFDRTFMINDGRLYPMYFMGWPILMAPGVWLGVSGYMNAFYSALTVPALYMAGQELRGRTVARAAVLLWLVSPMVMIAASTEMSNTTCVGALAWLYASYLRSRRPSAHLGWHVGVGAFFGLAALIRPTSALGIGGPVLLLWFFEAMRAPRSETLKRLLAVAIPGALALALFLGINKLQNGSLTLVSYIREFTYAKENGFRFNNWGAPGLREHAERISVPHFSNRGWIGTVANTAAAMLRLNFNMFGWIPSLVLVPLAWGRRGVGLLMFMGLGHLMVHARVADPGIDTFGPHHYFELALPTVFLTALGAHALHEWLAVRPDRESSWRLFPGALLAGLTLFAVGCTLPPRLRALSSMADDVQAPAEAVAKLGLGRVVAFAPRPFTASFARCSDGARHFVYWRPNNDPGLSNEVLWVNHISVSEDRRLMEHFPDRKGVILFFDRKCALRTVMLDKADPARVPDGDVEGTGTGIIGKYYRP